MSSGMWTIQIQTTASTEHWLGYRREEREDSGLICMFEEHVRDYWGISPNITYLDLKNQLLQNFRDEMRIYYKYSN